MIKKITTGKHAGEWSVRIQPRKNGKRISWPEKFVSSKRQALITENRMWADFQSGLDVNVAKAVFADEFQKYVNKRAKSISPVTLKSWQDSANAFKKYFGKTRVNQITTALVSDYAHDYVTKHQTTVSNSFTIAKRLVHMRNFFKSLQGRFIKEIPVPERALKTFLNKMIFQLHKNVIYLHQKNFPILES